MKNYQITSVVQTITPDLAKDILKGNTLNRPLNKKTVLDYARQMEKGLWKLNGEPIIVSRDGTLLDGQHRLEAVILSGVNITAVVIYNVDQESFSTIDTGRARTAGDVFSMDGVVNPVEKAALVSAYTRMLRTKDSTGKSSVGVLNRASLREINTSKSEILNFFKDNEELINSVHSLSTRCFKRLHLITKSILGGYALYLIKEKGHSLEKVSHFFFELYGIEPETNSTVGLLRNALLRHITKTNVLTVQQRHAYMIKTWNAYVSGKKLGYLKYDSDREKTLEFI